MQGLVTVFGGSGFVGTQVVRALAKAGYRVRVAVRQPNLAYRLPMLGDVGQIEVVQANLRNAPSVARALEGAEACVNLVGVLYEGGRQKFQTLHAMGARTVAAAAKAAGARRLVQMSALGADPDSPSRYARTKAMGETAAREAFPGAIVVRPSIVFGPEDAFFNRFGQMAALSPVLPLVGENTRFQPVFVGDVAAAIALAVAGRVPAGATLELGGPTTYSFRELLALILTETGRDRLLLPIPWPLAVLIGKLGDLQAAVLPLLAPPLTSDQVALLRSDNVVSGAHPGLASLGLVPTAVEAVVPAYLYRYRKGGQYAPAPAGAH